jgi:hypothetical protein
LANSQAYVKISPPVNYARDLRRFTGFNQLEILRTGPYIRIYDTPSQAATRCMVVWSALQRFFSDEIRLWLHEKGVAGLDSSQSQSALGCSGISNDSTSPFVTAPEALAPWVVSVASAAGVVGSSFPEVPSSGPPPNRLNRLSPSGGVGDGGGGGSGRPRSGGGRCTARSKGLAHWRQTR